MSLRHIVAKRPTGFKVVVDNGRSDLIEVLEGVYNLHDDGAALFLWHKLVLLQVEVQVVALTVLQNCAEPATREMHLTSVAGNGTSNQNKVIALHIENSGIWLKMDKTA